MLSLFIKGEGGGGPEFGKICFYNTCMLPIGWYIAEKYIMLDIVEKIYMIYDSIAAQSSINWNYFT